MFEALETLKKSLGFITNVTLQHPGMADASESFPACTKATGLQSQSVILAVCLRLIQK